MTTGRGMSRSSLSRTRNRRFSACSSARHAPGALRGPIHDLAGMIPQRKQRCSTISGVRLNGALEKEDEPTLCCA